MISSALSALSWIRLSQWNIGGDLGGIRGLGARRRQKSTIPISGIKMKVTTT